MVTTSRGQILLSKHIWSVVKQEESELGQTVEVGAETLGLDRCLEEEVT